MTKNLLFYIDESFAHFGIAKSLHEKLDCNLFAVIDVGDNLRNFLESQKIVPFQKIWNIRNIDLARYRKPDLDYLKSFEEKYKISIWKRAYAAGNLIGYNKFYEFKYNEILSILEQECKIFENALNETKIDFFIIKITDHHRIQLLYEIISALGIKPLVLSPTRIGYRAMISSDYEKIDSIDGSNNNKKSGIADISFNIEDYLKKFNTFEQQKKRSSLGGTKTPSKFSRNLQFIKSSFAENRTNYYTNYGKTPKKIIIDKFISRPYRNWVNRRFFDKHAIRDITSDTPFVYFPLHVEPERTLMIFAPFYTNQLQVITHLAKSLPIEYKLFVKEHPFMIKIMTRNTSYYKKIIDLPNVKLVHPSVKPEELLKKCSMVATISGTTAFEAAFYQKPSIVFADVSFSYLPFIYKIKNLEELPNIFRNWRKQKFDFSIVGNYVSLVDQHSFEFDLIKYYDDVKKEIYQFDVLQIKSITEQTINAYLDKHKSDFDILGTEYLKKINQYG